MNDGETSKTKKLHVSKTKPKEKEDEKEWEEEVTEDDETSNSDEEFIAETDGGSDSESDGVVSDDAEEGRLNAGRKRKRVTFSAKINKPPPAKKEKTENKEKKHPPGRRGKKDAPLFNSKNPDYDLFNSSPENVTPRRVRLSSNVILMCKMIDSSDSRAGNLSYDYAALTFQRKAKDDHAFEFNLPLSLAPKIIQALQFIMKDNETFFAPKI